MIRGSLDDTTEAIIDTQLPDLSELVAVAPYLSLDWISTWFGDEPNVPIAGVCLHDAISTLEAARFAVHESLAHQLWYKEYASEFRNPEIEAAWYARFFSDDAALRLYAVGEHLATAIIYTLKLDENILRTRTSLQTKVTHICKSFPGHPVTKSVMQLKASPQWVWTRNYRDRWVHEQPPLMEGFGIQFERRSRWRKVENTVIPQRMMPLSSGDKPQYTIDQLVANVCGALIAVTQTTRVVTKSFIQVIEDKQEERNHSWSEASSSQLPSLGQLIREANRITTNQMEQAE